MKDRLKALRKSLGLTQREMAEKLGVRLNQYGSWEYGYKGVSRASAFQICQTFGVRPEWLETGEGEMWATVGGNDISRREIEKDAFRRLFAGFPDDAKQMVGELIDEWRASKETAEE